MAKFGLSRGKHLRVGANVSVYEYLVHGFFLRTSLEDMHVTWFDFTFAKTIHTSALIVADLYMLLEHVTPWCILPRNGGSG